MAEGSKADFPTKKLAAAFSLYSQSKGEIQGSELKRLLEAGFPGNKQITRAMDSSIMPVLVQGQKDKKKFAINDEKIRKFVTLLAANSSKSETDIISAIVNAGDAKEKALKKEADKMAKKSDDVTGRLTDTSKYTGSHSQRFDETGKGKGLEGRTDKADNSGYVGNYKGAGSYDKK